MPGPYYIAVMGVTGAGKSTFISKATGDDDVVIGHGLDSCTKDIQEFECWIDGKEVVLLDTPGFDDTYESDGDILENIAMYMQEKHDEGILLTGLILLQPINTTRLTSSEKRNTRLFKAILGENAYHRVVIGTTMWETMVDSGTGQMNSEQRKNRSEAWGDMVAAGATVKDHQNTTESAHQIIRHILRHHRQGIDLRIQQELSQTGHVYRTSAGRQLDKDLGDIIEKLSQQIEMLQNQHRSQWEELREARERLEKYESTRSSFRSRARRMAQFFRFR